MNNYKDIGFELVEEKIIPEIDSNVMVFNHIKTGARVLKIDNDDINNVFGIGFKTPPEDSTGVAHILEHSVLSGSRKYKTKEPFMDVYKGSLQTFLNAITFGDKTLYPIGSRNDQDFKNLMDVYLDAVFYPAIGEKPEISMQEGWHYEIQDKDEDIEYTGVVYNEMKGAMSTPEDQLYEFIGQSLYPDTIYRHNSGGDPYEIPKLSQEGLVAFHEKHYHPSNSYIFYYGDREIYDDLKYLDEEYLSNFDRATTDSDIPYQEPFERKRYENYEYSTSDNVDGLDRDYLAYSLVTGDIREENNAMITSILIEALVNSDAAPIKKALLDAKIGEDIFGSTSNIQQVPFNIIAKNTSSSKVNEFEGVIETALQNLVDNGIDKDLLKSTLNKFEYSLREASGYATKGVIYYIQAFNTWLYGQSPIKALEFEEDLEALRQGIDEGLFEKFIEDKILKNNHKTIISALPSPGLNERKDEEVKKDLVTHKESLSEEALENLIASNKKLEEMQLTEDSDEAKATIPSLSLEDVNTNLEDIPRERLDSTIDNLYHDIFTSGINYVDIVFDIGHIDTDEIKYASLLTDLLGSMDTSRRNYSELANEIYLSTGGISIGINVYNDINGEDFYPKLVVSTKYLSGNGAASVDIIGEILANTELTNEKRYKDLIKEIKSRYEMNLYGKGSSVVMSRSASYVEKSAKYQEYVGGIDYFNFIQDLDREIEENAQDQLGKLREVYDKLLTTKGLIINITSSREEAEEFLRQAENDLAKFKDIDYEPADLVFRYIAKNEGIKSSSNVQYVSKAAKLDDLGMEYNGKLVVLSQILSRGYLHNNIRAKGGAYGAGITIGKRTLGTYSYRDPNLKETIKVYDNMGNYLKNFEIGQEELENYIIGSMGRFNPPYTARTMGQTDLSRYINGSTKEDIEKNMREALATSVDDLKEFGSFLDRAMEENNLCVLGNKEVISENAELFDQTFDIIK